MAGEHAHWSYDKRQGWLFYQPDDHPIEEWAVASAIGPLAYGRPGLPREGYVRLVLTGVRKGDSASDIEISAGLMLYGDFKPEDLFARDTSDAYKESRQIRLKEHLDASTTGFGLDRLRGYPREGVGDRIPIFFGAQMPHGWGSDGRVNEAPESAFSGRTQPLAEGDVVAFALPWRHKEGEILYILDVKYLHYVRAALMAMLTL